MNVVLHVVLQPDRDAVQRTAHLALRALAVALVGELQRVRVHRDRGVQPVLVHRDAREVLLDDLMRRTRPSRIAACMSGIVASTTVNGFGAFTF